MNGRHARRRHDDSGAALILAIAFVVMIGAISAGMAGLATSSLNHRDTLERVRNREYAADGAIERAISDVRSSTTAPLVACATSTGFVTDTLNGYAIRVDWRHDCDVVRTPDGLVVAQRDVILTACENLAVVCAETAVIIRAQVNFEQSVGVVTKTYVQSWSVNR